MESSEITSSPQTQKFYRRFATVMTLFGMGNRAWWGYEAPTRFMLIHRIIITFITHLSLLLEIIFLVLYYNTLSAASLRTLFLMFPLDVLTSIFLTAAQTKNYRKLMKKYMHKIHLLSYFKGDNSLQQVQQKAEKADYYTRITAYSLITCSLMDCSLWFVARVYHYSQNKEEIKNKTVMLQTVLHWWTPYDYKYNIKNWAITQAVHAYSSYIGCFIVSSCNTLNFMFVFHLIGHVQMLKHKFRTEFSTPLSDSDTKKKLINLIKHHSFIIEAFEDTQTAFGYAVTANYGYNLLCDSLLVYEIMQGEKKDTLLFSLMLLIFMGGLTLMSLVLEEIRRESYDLADVIYSIPWEKMSISNQKTFMMILARAQPPLEFVSAGGLRAGVNPTISIIKSTFSYYVMLKSTMKDEK